MTTGQANEPAAAELTITRVDRSPMNPKVWVVELACGHDIYKYRKPRMTQKFACERGCKRGQANG